MHELLVQFHFLRPWWFLALFPVALCGWALWLSRKQNHQLTTIFNPAFLPFLLDKAELQQKKWPLAGLLALWLLATVALAGPAWQKVPQPVERNTEALVIVWDMSPSMLAQDVKPSRLVRSRLKLIDLLHSKTDGQVALIAYAGDAHVVTPLTDDYQTIINLLPALAPTTLPSSGSNAEAALSQAIKLLNDGGAQKGDILFITDAISPLAFDTMASTLRDTPHTLSVWGVGSAQGAPIPLPEGGFAKDSGGIVVAKLNETELARFTTRISGNYVPMLTGESDVGTLLQLLKPSTRQSETSERTFDQWFEHGQYLAVLLLPLAAWFFRRGWIFCLFFMTFAGALSPREVQALEWDDLWLNQDQRAQQQLEKGDAQAAQAFTTPARRGAALYRNENYVEAAREFADAKNAESAYNRGNALTQAGRYADAITAFDKALELDPSLTQARDNREIARQLAELEQQQEQQSDGNQPDEQNDKDQQQNEQQGEDQQSKQDQGQQQEPSEGGDEQNDQSQQGSEQSSDGEQSEESGTGGSDSSSPEPMSDDAERQEGQPAEGENPYSDAQQSAEERSDEQQQAGEVSAAPTDAASDGEQQQGQVAVESGQTEEEQMLEQWLRKVPDDPSGLLRNKFRYEHMQRQRRLDSPSAYADDQAQQRW